MITSFAALGIVCHMLPVRGDDVQHRRHADYPGMDCSLYCSRTLLDANHTQIARTRKCSPAHSQAPMSKPPSCGRGRARVVRCHDVGEIEAGINGPAPRLEVEVGRARTHKVWITK
jgi:hypothetical protein